MLYRPKLKNGQYVPLIWPLACYRIINAICWPLEESTSKTIKILDRCYLLLLLLVSLQHLDAQTRFMRQNYKNFDELLSVLPTYIGLTEIIVRALYVGLYKQERMELLKKFYAEVYIEKSSNPELYQSIQRKLRPTFAFSFSYMTVLATYVYIPLKSILKHRRDLMTKMIYPYDLQPLVVYVPTILACSWLGTMSITTLMGEANIMSEIMMHLHGQYLTLGTELECNSSKFLERLDDVRIAEKFSAKLKVVIQRNVELNQFAVEFQKFFTLQIFLTHSSAAIVLCVLVFKVYTSLSESIPLIIWMISKILGMIAFGELGSTLMATSDKVSSMYYNSNWELIISASKNTKSNVELMKLLMAAIQMNRKPFTLSGFKFFSVSLTTVGKILQGAGSYFTCLISVHLK